MDTGIALLPPGLRQAAPAYRPLGGFRLLLALLVVVQHQLHLLPAAARAPFYRLELGVLAVAAFFAISGFIVAEAVSTFYAGRPGAFLANRALRLVPCYLAAVVLAAAAQGALYAAGRLVPLDGPLTGSPLSPAVLGSALLEILPGMQPKWLIGQDFSLIPFAWTLRVEAAFYAAVALTVLAGRLVRGAALSAILVAYVAFFAALLSRHGPQQCLYIPFFLVGVALYRHRVTRTRWSAGWLAGAAAAAALAFPFWMQRGAPLLAWQGPILAVLLAVVVALALAPPVGARWRQRDRAAGDLSYPLYLGHGVVLIVLADAGLPLGVGLYAAGLALSLGLAALLHRWVERPVARWRAAVRGRAL